MSRIFLLLTLIGMFFFSKASAQAQLPDGLAAYYKFNNNIYDDSGNENHGSAYGGAWVNGRVGSALYLDGIDDHVIVPDSQSLNQLVLSIETWLKLASPAPAWGAAIVEKDGWNGGKTGYAFLVGNWGSDNSLVFEVYSPYRAIVSNATLSIDQWYHVVATYDGSDMNIYINGSLDNTYHTSGYLNTGNDGILGIGARFVNSGVNWNEINQTIQGAVDELAIYNRALSPEEINRHYENGLLGLGYAEQPVGDNDNDGVLDTVDNCPMVTNTDQLDTDGDGKGDACDADNDEDTILDVSDNCPFVSNADQSDLDGDGIGDVCDADNDNDGVLNDADNCPSTANADQHDSDGDGAGDACDNDLDGDGVDNAIDSCPSAVNPLQEDNNSNGIGDACDPDDDSDGIVDEADNCPLLINSGQDDLDADNIGDDCDADIDGDGVENDYDNCAFMANLSQDDADWDEMGDACDMDDDNDGVVDGTDNCQFSTNTDQADTDADGIGNACDTDFDGDGIENAADNCPMISNANQADWEADGEGDACDTDVDGDEVPNSADICQFTSLDGVVDPATGCSIAQLCPCTSPRGTTAAWKNHGQYVSCVAKSSENFVLQGLMSPIQKDTVVSQAANSACGSSK